MHQKTTRGRPREMNSPLALGNSWHRWSCSDCESQPVVPGRKINRNSEHERSKETKWTLWYYCWTTVNKPTLVTAKSCWKSYFLSGVTKWLRAMEARLHTATCKEICTSLPATWGFHTKLGLHHRKYAPHRDLCIPQFQYRGCCTWWSPNSAKQHQIRFCKP